MTITVICAYHEGAKKAFEPFITEHPDVFLPILGGACYYQKGKDPFYDQLKGDNTGENISPLMVYVNEHTPLYWAYKNYREIGNPDMIGLCHYRRYLDVDYNNLDKNKIYAVRGPARHNAGIKGLVEDFVSNTYDNFCSHEILELYLDSFRYALPEYAKYLDLTLNEISYYPKNMFIMSRENFQDFMSFICRSLRVLFDDFNYQEAMSIFYPDLHVRRLMLQYSRCRGFMMELFTSVWMERQYQLKRNVVASPIKEFIPE